MTAIESLKQAEHSIAEAIASKEITEETDFFELRYILNKLPGIIGRMEKKGFGG